MASNRCSHRAIAEIIRTPSTGSFRFPPIGTPGQALLVLQGRPRWHSPRQPLLEIPTKKRRELELAPRTARQVGVSNASPADNAKVRRRSRIGDIVPAMVIAASTNAT